MVYTYNGILFGHKKEWTSNTDYPMVELWKHYANEISDMKGKMLYDSTSMKCVGSVNS